MLDIKKLMIKILKSTNNLQTPSDRFAITQHSLGQRTVAKDSYIQGTLNISKAGYRPIAIIGHRATWVSGSTYGINWFHWYLNGIADGSGVINYGIGNTGTSSGTFNPTFDILWAKVGGVAHKLRNTLKSLTSERRWAI